MASDGRIMKRNELVFYLEVSNTETGESVGRLVDLTTRGCKIVEKQEYDAGLEMALKVTLPDDRYGVDELYFNAIVRWSKPDINPDYLVTGFEIIRLGARERKVVRKLVEQFGFNGDVM